MKFTASKEAILKEIIIANDIISDKNIVSILSNVLLETSDDTLTIRASDLKVSFETQIPVDTEINGTTTVMCEKLFSILRSLPEGDIEFEFADGKLYIIKRDEKIHFSLRCIDPKDFPQFKAPSEYTLSIPKKDFVEMIDHTMFSVSDDETRYYMNGVYLEPGQQSLIMVSTDGRKLSFIDRNIKQDVPFFEPIIIPPKFLQLIKKVSSKEGEISLTISDSHIYADFDSHHLASTLIEGKFPNYKRVIPLKQENVCIIKSKEFLEALRRVSLLVDQKSRRIYIDIQENNLVISSEESELGTAKEELTCNHTGEEGRIIMNCTYLINPLRVMNCEYIALAFHDPTKAVTMRPEPEEDYFHIIMPMS